MIFHSNPNFETALSLLLHIPNNQGNLGVHIYSFPKIQVNPGIPLDGMRENRELTQDDVDRDRLFLMKNLSQDGQSHEFLIGEEKLHNCASISPQVVQQLEASGFLAIWSRVTSGNLSGYFGLKTHLHYSPKSQYLNKKGREYCHEHDIQKVETEDVVHKILDPMAAIYHAATYYTKKFWKDEGWREWGYTSSPPQPRTLNITWRNWDNEFQESLMDLYPKYRQLVESYQEIMRKNELSEGRRINKEDWNRDNWAKPSTGEGQISNDPDTGAVILIYNTGSEENIATFPYKSAQLIAELTPAYGTQAKSVESMSNKDTTSSGHWADYGWIVKRSHDDEGKTLRFRSGVDKNLLIDIPREEFIQALHIFETMSAKKIKEQAEIDKEKLKGQQPGEDPRMVEPREKLEKELAEEAKKKEKEQSEDNKFLHSMRIKSKLLRRIR